MHILEEGIIEPSQIYFLSPSDFARETLYCLQHIGIFYCDMRYIATHPYWESILILFIDEGEMEVTVEDKTFIAQANDIVLIDCRKEHKYRAKENLNFHYFHFTGMSSAPYFELITNINQGVHIKDGQNEVLDSAFHNLFRLAQGQSSMQNEHRISVYIHMILSNLVETQSSVPAVTNQLIDKAIAFMEKHVTENVSLDDIANHLNISKYYFARNFKKHTGMSPHLYFVNMRIQYAKRLLITSHSSVEDIANECGFDNVSNFIRVFKKRTNLTPSQFRKISF
ncbi:AraC family transcriptional regulator [Oceanobacillus oncorhynchi subsp. oncorhynchi]|uniref:AraC family transcriptional regulator n=1 Tax=Oceanobacillus oncorhynchi TaxID=545501 RepID=UPI0031E3BD39